MRLWLWWDKHYVAVHVAAIVATVVVIAVFG